MATIVYSDDNYDRHGLVSATRVYDDGTVQEVEGGKVVRTRAATADELARAAEYANPTPSTEERIATLEADLAVAKEQAAKADALQTLLVDKGVIAEADVVAIAAPAEEVAIKR